MSSTNLRPYVQDPILQVKIIRNISFLTGLSDNFDDHVRAFQNFSASKQMIYHMGGFKRLVQNRIQWKGEKHGEAYTKYYDLLKAIDAKHYKDIYPLEFDLKMSEYAFDSDVEKAVDLLLAKETKKKSKSYHTQIKAHLDPLSRYLRGNGEFELADKEKIKKDFLFLSIYIFRGSVCV